MNANFGIQRMKSQRPDGLEGTVSRSDAELVHAARRGDKRAFVEIVARHQAMVCGIALGILGDFGASEDAGQEAFLTAWRKFHDLREPERLRAWLGQIARNAALGQLRRRRGHDALDEDLSLVDESPTPDEAAASEEEAALVRESLSKLPEVHRLPLILYYREGKSVKAVADALGISEDAVKQRLARGREMLRERMAGMVEGVLTRTTPNAIFTMTIAVAIGALAAPAAVAGAAFTAASVAGAGTTTATASSTPSIITVMSTSKSFLVATALIAVVCVPIGYGINSATSSPAGGSTASNVEPEPVVATTTNARPSFESSALFAEWRKLHEQHGTNAQAMPELHKAITGIRDTFRRNAFRAALISEWVQVDPAGGFKFILGKGSDATQRRQFFEEWLARDPSGAVAALINGGKGWETVARESLSEIARHAPSSVPDIVSRLPKPESYWDTNVRDAFAILAEGGFASARKAAEEMTGPNRDQALAGIARIWGKGDLKEAIAWAKALPEGTDRNEIIRAALMGRAGVDPTAALELAGTVPAGGRQNYFATTTGARVLAEAGKADFNATVAWLAANPGRFGHEDLVGLAHTVTELMNADPEAFLSARVADGSLAAILPAISSALLNEAGGQRATVWEWIKTQPHNEATKLLQDHVLSSGAWQDPALAMKFAAELPRTAEGDTQIQSVARSLFNGGSMLNRFDELITQAPDRLRPALIETAFELLRTDSMNEPQTWISRVSLLPETARAKAMSSIARAWAGRAPEEAVAWASSLSSSETQSGAMAAVASAWAAKDAHSAAEWVGSLPAGAGRDRSAESLVMTVAQQFPREAWDWALSIGSAAERNRAAQHAARAMAARDPVMARQLIEAGPFEGQMKMDLLAALEKGKGR
jgi:RNA polymerase sigma factor (sigma-70 family)